MEKIYLCRESNSGPLVHLADAGFRPADQTTSPQRHRFECQQKVIPFTDQLREIQTKTVRNTEKQGKQISVYPSLPFNYATILPITFKLTQAHSLKQYQT